MFCSFPSLPQSLPPLPPSLPPSFPFPLTIISPLNSDAPPPPPPPPPAAASAAQTTAGHQVGSRAVELASDVSTEIKKSVSELKDDIRRHKEQAEDSTYTSAVATVESKEELLFACSIWLAYGFLARWCRRIIIIIITTTATTTTTTTAATTTTRSY